MRCTHGHVQRGDWWNGIVPGFEMTFLITTLMIPVGVITIDPPVDGMKQVDTVMVLTRPNLLAVASVFYASRLMIAIVVGSVYTLTSPFRYEQE